MNMQMSTCESHSHQLNVWSGFFILDFIPPWYIINFLQKNLSSCIFYLFLFFTGNFSRKKNFLRSFCEKIRLSQKSAITKRSMEQFNFKRPPVRTLRTKKKKKTTITALLSYCVRNLLESQIKRRIVVVVVAFRIFISKRNTVLNRCIIIHVYYQWKHFIILH